MVSDRAFIFHIHVYYFSGKSLSLVPRSRSNVKVTVFEKMAVAGALVFHKYSLLPSDIQVHFYKLHKLAF